jgi:Carboxypeptidase regulatory-like domain
VLISGAVRDGAGRPVAQARVFFSEGPVSPPDIATLTGTDGRFVLSAPAAGTYVVQGHHEDYGPASVTVDVPQDKDVAVDLNLPDPR